MKLTNTLFLIGLLAGAVGLLYAYFVNPPRAQAQEAEQPAVPASPVQIERATVTTVTETIAAVGSLRANESAVISPELSGRIEAIEFNEGERVPRGQPLIYLDDAIYQAQLAQAEASLELSQANYERAEDLLARNAGSATARDETLARQRVDEAALALAQAQLAKRTIRAPFTGVIGLRSVSVGDYIVPGQDAVTLVDIDPIKVDFRIPEVYLAELREGQKIAVTVDALPGEIFEGEVYAIDPVIDINGRAIQLRATIPNPDGSLRPGLFARVEVNVDTRENAVLIDESALLAQEDGKYVYRLQDGRARLTPVEVGIRQPGQVEITEGLAPGAAVVTAGHQNLSDGAPVEVVESPAGS